ncbi:MAG: hypothetical protein PHY31_04525, partial [Smithellaceae bacterium]|nr:hypothetical protein [Smithellaceae bacterium]
MNITGETSKLEQALARASSLVHSAVTNIGKTLVIGIGGALATAAGTAVAAIWQWAKEEQSVTDLSSSIKMLGGDVEQLVPKYERVMAQIQQNTTIADDASRSAMAYAASMGAPVDRLDDLAIAAAGLSARLGMSMRTAMMLLTRSLTSGQFTLFTRYGLAIDKTKTKTEQFAQVIEFANKGFGKQADMVNTITSRLTQLKNNFGDIMEALGKNLAERFKIKEIFETASKAMFRFGQSIQLAIDKIKPGTFGLGKLADRFDKIGERLVAIALFLPSLWKAGKGIFGNWENFKDVFKTILKEGASLFLTTLIEGFKMLRPLFQGLGEIVASAVEGYLSRVPILNKLIIGRPLAEMAEADVRQELGYKPGEAILDGSDKRKIKQRYLDMRAEYEENQFSGGGKLGERMRQHMIATAAKRIETGATRAIDSINTFTDAVSKKYSEAVDAILVKIEERTGVDFSKEWEDALAAAAKAYLNAASLQRGLG